MSETQSQGARRDPPSGPTVSLGLVDQPQSPRRPVERASESPWGYIIPLAVFAVVTLIAVLFKQGIIHF